MTSPAAMPSEVPVAGQVFTITVAPRASMKPDGLELLGQMDARTQAIKISDEQALGSERETVLHEVLHAVRCLSALPLRETEVQVMAAQLVDVMRRNPDLVAYLMAKE